ncbi:MAG TPA: hypothetical protein VF230_13455 [Acidimicrobiales bacterium]
MPSATSADTGTNAAPVGPAVVAGATVVGTCTGTGALVVGATVVATGAVVATEDDVVDDAVPGAAVLVVVVVVGGGGRTFTTNARDPPSRSSVTVTTWSPGGVLALVDTVNVTENAGPRHDVSLNDARMPTSSGNDTLGHDKPVAAS